MRYAILLVLICTAAAFAVPAERFTDSYFDVVNTKLSGFSTSQTASTGLRKGRTSASVSISNDYFDTTGTSLPWQYSGRGTSVGVGVRRYWPGNKIFLGTSLSQGVRGANKGHTDFRVLTAGYNAWEKGKRFTDVYGDTVWTSRTKDVYANVRVRSGRILADDRKGRVWAYGVGQVMASGKGDNGTENRVEAGVGVSYILKWKVSACLEYRQGHSFSGATTQRNYTNPTFVVAGNMW